MDSEHSAAFLRLSCLHEHNESLPVELPCLVSRQLEFFAGELGRRDTFTPSPFALGLAS